MRAVLTIGGASIEFTERLAGGQFPYLQGVGSLRRAVRAGYRSGLGVGESPSLAVTLNNDGNRAADIIGHPLRASAAVYDDADDLIWSGAISRIVYGRVIELTVEA